MLTSRPLITNVEEHADKHKKVEDLTEREFLNKLCDEAAKDYWDIVSMAQVPEPWSDIWMGPTTPYAPMATVMSVLFDPV